MTYLYRQEECRSTCHCGCRCERGWCCSSWCSPSGTRRWCSARLWSPPRTAGHWQGCQGLRSWSLGAKTWQHINTYVRTDSLSVRWNHHHQHLVVSHLEKGVIHQHLNPRPWCCERPYSISRGACALDVCVYWVLSCYAMPRCVGCREWHNPPDVANNSITLWSWQRIALKCSPAVWLKLAGWWRLCEWCDMIWAWSPGLVTGLIWVACLFCSAGVLNYCSVHGMNPFQHRG